MYRIEIDRSLCSGYGTCIDAAPGVFELDDDLVAVVLLEQSDAPAVQDAARSCPMGAITLVETRPEAA